MYFIHRYGSNFRINISSNELEMLFIENGKTKKKEKKRKN